MEPCDNQVAMVVTAQSQRLGLHARHAVIVVRRREARQRLNT